jgi:hypothetical protein
MANLNHGLQRETWDYASACEHLAGQMRGGRRKGVRLEAGRPNL